MRYFCSSQRWSYRKDKCTQWRNHEIKARGEVFDQLSKAFGIIRLILIHMDNTLSSYDVVCWTDLDFGFSNKLNYMEKSAMISSHKKRDLAHFERISPQFSKRNPRWTSILLGSRKCSMKIWQNIHQLVNS